jgi:hypothetical protein
MPTQPAKRSATTEHVEQLVMTALARSKRDAAARTSGLGRNRYTENAARLVERTPVRDLTWWRED